MDTPLKNETEILDFLSFIKEYFDWYIIDQYNMEIIKNLNLWANRSEKFNGKQIGWHIDRGILLIGSVGSGKDELFRMLNRYLTYLRSNYKFDQKVVWKFASDFMKDSYLAFENEGKQNRYYEELCLTDEQNNYPTREVVNHYGNKILIGAELIHNCYNWFKNRGRQSHFSTNVGADSLRLIYGERIYSRLREMCNFMVYTGVDRRIGGVPVFNNNFNNPQPPEDRVASQTPEETHIYNKKRLDATYRKYKEKNELPDTPWLVYNLLVSYGVVVCEDEDMRTNIECVAPGYSAGLAPARKSSADQQKEKDTWIWNEARKVALRNYFQLLKEKGAESIFEEVQMNLLEVTDKLAAGLTRKD